MWIVCFRKVKSWLWLHNPPSPFGILSLCDKFQHDLAKPHFLLQAQHRTGEGVRGGGNNFIIRSYIPLRPCCLGGKKGGVTKGYVGLKKKINDE